MLGAVFTGVQIACMPGLDVPLQRAIVHIDPDLRKIVDKHWNIIEYSRDCAELFKEKPIIGFRKLPNLKDKLTNAKCIYPETQQKKTGFC